ncbi:MAG: DUF4007 family protein [Spirochaetes bacterium]|nr:DUF4007 family protein [Spirochaetota bacterium]
MKDVLKLKEIYRYEKKTDTYNIDISLDQYSDIFNEWDFAPFTKRDIDPDLIEFIEECALEIPLKSKISINFYIPEKLKDEDIEEKLKRIIKNNLKFGYRRIYNEKRRLIKSTSIYAITGVIFLLLSSFVEDLIKISMIKNIIANGIMIGAWVLIWDIFSTIFFKLKELNFKIKVYEKLIYSSINFYDY